MQLVQHEKCVLSLLNYEGTRGGVIYRRHISLFFCLLTRGAAAAERVVAAIFHRYLLF